MVINTIRKTQPRGGFHCYKIGKINKKYLLKRPQLIVEVVTNVHDNKKIMHNQRI